MLLGQLPSFQGALGGVPFLAQQVAGRIQSSVTALRSKKYPIALMSFFVAVVPVFLDA